MGSFVVFDIETTGLNPALHKITEIGAVKINNNKIVDTFSQLINPRVVIPSNITELTGITQAMVENEPDITVVLPEFIEFCADYDVMGHNIMFDYSFIKTQAKNLGIRFEKKGIDTLFIAKKFMKEPKSKSLTSLCSYYNIKREYAHRAFHDAVATFELYQCMKKDYDSQEGKKDFLGKVLHFKPKKDEPSTLKQQKYLTSLVEKYSIKHKKEITSLTKSEASKAIDHIIRTYGK